MKVTTKAHQKHIRQSPRKLRLVADLVRKMGIDEAQTQLKIADKKAATALLKVIKQAKANAINNLNCDPKSIAIQTIDIQEGPVYKRWQPVSRGRAHPILKRTSHIKVVVSGQTQS